MSLYYATVGWLLDRFPGNVELDSFGEEGQPLRAVLELCLPEIEDAVLVHQERTPAQLLQELAGQAGTSPLRWLIDLLATLPGSEKVRDHVYDSLRVVVALRPEDSALSRTFARGVPVRPYLHRDGLIRRVDLHTVIEQPLPTVRVLSPRERGHLVDAGRAVLAVVGRETEPICFCRPEGVEHVELERGAAVALYWLPPGRHLSLDSQVGFMVFKNTLPVAYGGGWPFFGMCRIGVNIFDAYRGGESAFLFGQVLRVFRQRFGIERFLIEAFQFGADNREGIRSGAFWFYYRLGFRPVDPRPAALAEREFARMEADGTYRTPPEVLRRLAGSDLELVLTGAGAPAAWCDPVDLSLAVTRWIGTNFGGDRRAAKAEAVRRVIRSLEVTDLERWPEQEREAFRSLCLLVAPIQGLGQWPKADRRRTVALMRARGRRTGQAFLDGMRRHHQFRAAMVQLAGT